MKIQSVAGSHQELSLYLFAPLKKADTGRPDEAGFGNYSDPGDTGGIVCQSQPVLASEIASSSRETLQVK